MLAESLTHRRAAGRRAGTAVPGDIGDDVLVTCDRTGDGLYEVLAGIRSPHVLLPGLRFAGCGRPEDWHRSACAAKPGAVRIGGEGVFRSNETRLRLSAARGCALRWRWRLHIPLTGTLEGPFDVTVLREAGAAGEGWLFELGSSGQLSFCAR